MEPPKNRRRKRIREVTTLADRKIGAEVVNSARYQGARVAVAFAESIVDHHRDKYTPSIADLAAELRRTMAGVKAGNLEELEAMLLAQANALQSIFTHFGVKLAGPWSMTLSPQYAAIAFKAQSQARATITALADMKQPRHANYIGQQNVAVNQQVNNGLPAPAQSSDFPPIEILEAHHGERMDTRTSGSASGSHSPLDAVEEGDGAAHDGGQDEGES